MRGALRFVVAFALLVPAAAMGASRREHDRPFSISQARALHGAEALPTQVAGVSVSPAEGIASYTRTVTVTLTDVASGPVDVALPALFGRRSATGHAFVLGQPQGRRHLDSSGRSFSFDVSNLPAGTYALPIIRGGRTVGTARFRLYVPRREGAGEAGSAGERSLFGPVGRVAIDSSQDATDENESFVALAPLDPQRVVAYGNDLGYPTTSGDGGVAISNDGGATWAHPQFPEVFATPNGINTEYPSGDPILAIDDQGNVWAGGLSVCSSASAQGRIFVNRIAPGQTTFQSRNAGLPVLHTGNTCDPASGDFGVLQDKPQMAIDNTPTSPTYGRLYVTWDDPAPGGGDNEVISFCDTRPGGFPNAAHCDTGANWSTPAVVSDADPAQGGSFITSDVAVGPDGKVYMVWWDWAGADNKISADMCSSNCASSASWGSDKTIAALSTHSNKPVPFACPTLAQPGGRAGPTPSIEVDHSGGADNGRIYVGWGDLATDGNKRCSGTTAPTATQDAFEAFVASAPDFATLTSGTPLSGARGTNVIADTSSDHWFPWVAIDQSDGQAYVDLYSTRDDATRLTSQFYKATISPTGGTPVTVSGLTKVSTTAQTFSDTTPYGQFQNDYGDYTGLAASQGVVAPVWVQRTLLTDGDIDVDLPATWPAHVTAGGATIAEAAGADGDGQVEPGEPFTLTAPLHNDGPGTLDNVTAQAKPMQPTVSLTNDTSGYGTLAAGTTAANSVAFTGSLSPTVPCGVSIDFRLAVTTTSDGASRAVQVAVPTAACPPPTPPPTTTTTTPPPPPPPPPVDRTPPRLRVVYATRADRKGRYKLTFAAAGEKATGRVTMQLLVGKKRRTLAKGRFTTAGTKTVHLVLRLKRKDLALLKRRHKLRIRLTVSLADVAGNTAQGTKTLTLRLSRR